MAMRIDFLYHSADHCIEFVACPFPEGSFRSAQVNLCETSNHSCSYFFDSNTLKDIGYFARDLTYLQILDFGF